MAPSTSAHQRERSINKPRVQPVLPALPLLHKSKKSVQESKEVHGIVEESPTTNGQSKGVSNTPSETRLSVPVHENDASLKIHHDFSTPSVSIPDESASVQSSQEPNSIIDLDSSVSSAITSEHVDSSVPTLRLPASDPANGKISDETNNIVAEGSGLGVNGSPAIAEERDTIDARDTMQEQITPDTANIVPEISPVPISSEDKLPVELSAFPPTTQPSLKGEVSAEADRAMDTNRPPGEQYQSRRDELRNGHTSTASLPRVYNNQPDPAPVIKSLPTVLEHLLFLANSKQLADWTIQVELPGSNMQPFVTYAHAFILLRSERMRKAMAHPSEPLYNLPVIHLAPVRVVQPHAFEAALRFLYSDTVLSPEALFPRDTYMDRHARAHIVDYVISYWIAGIELGVDPVSARAYSLLAGMMDWDIAEILVREAYTLRAAVVDHRSPREIILMAESILRLVFGLFIHRFDPEHFRLDTNNQYGVMSSRFAQLDQSKPSSNPVLASMVFGSMPSTTDVSPALSTDEASWSADNVASSIFLNLDFADLSMLGTEFVRTYGKFGSKVLSDVVNEREKRRLQIWGNKAISSRERVANSAIWDVVGWREDFQHGKLSRERLGYILPSKKGV